MFPQDHYTIISRKEESRCIRRQVGISLHIGWRQGVGTGVGVRYTGTVHLLYSSLFWQHRYECTCYVACYPHSRKDSGMEGTTEATSLSILATGPEVLSDLRIT